MLSFAPISGAAISALSGASATLTDVFVAGEVGTLVIVGTANASLTTVTAAGDVGSLLVAVPASVLLTGLAALVNQGNVLVWGETPVPPPGNWIPVSGAPGGGWLPIAPPTTEWVPVVT